jgi:hypothetical protein
VRLDLSTRCNSPINPRCRAPWREKSSSLYLRTVRTSPRKVYDGSHLFSERLSMKRMLATVCVTVIAVVAIAGSTNAQSPQPTKLESELRSVLRERWAALARNDAEAYGAFLDDDVVIPDNGMLYDKKALIERARTLKETSSEARDVQVHGYKDAAVMVYRTTSREQLFGREMTEELRIVETYVKRNGSWLLAARAESEIPNANRLPAKVAPEILDEYVGEYQISPGNVVKITREGDHLMEQGSDDPKPEADLPLSASAFFQREQPGVLTFTRSPNGKVETYVLWIYDTTITGKKIK